MQLENHIFTKLFIVHVHVWNTPFTVVVLTPSGDSVNRCTETEAATYC